MESWVERKRFPTVFCQKDKTTVEYVRDRLLPELEAEANLLEELNKEYVSTGLDGHFADEIAELRRLIAIGKERLLDAITIQRNESVAQ